MHPPILIVEDHEDSREMLAYIVAAQGYRVLTAEDGQGLAMALTERPAVIITDIQMPILDGIGMIKELRATPAVADVPILVLTAFKSGSTSEALRVGADRAMRKPLTVEGLMLAIEELVKRGH